MRASFFWIAQIVGTWIPVVAQAVVDYPVAVVVLLVALLAGSGKDRCVTVIAVATAIAARNRHSDGSHVEVAESVVVVIAAFVHVVVAIVVDVVAFLLLGRRCRALGQAPRRARPCTLAFAELVHVETRGGYGFLDCQEGAFACSVLRHALLDCLTPELHQLARIAGWTWELTAGTIRTAETASSVGVLQAQGQEFVLPPPRHDTVVVGRARVAQGQVAGDANEVHIALLHTYPPRRAGHSITEHRTSTAFIRDDTQAADALLVECTWPKELTLFGNEKLRPSN